MRAETAGISRALWSAVFGGVVWVNLSVLAAAGYVSLELVECLFLLAPLVVVPLGVELVTARRQEQPSGPLFRTGVLLQPLGAALAIASFLLPTGEIAGLAAAGWLVVTVLLSLSGLRMAPNIFTRPEVTCMEAGLLYLPVGGIWLVLSRLGETPLVLGEPIILLTAVHFHYAGFAASVLAGATGRALPSAGGLFRIVALGVTGGTFLVAVCFLLSPAFKVAAIALFVASLLALAVFSGIAVRQVRRRAARALVGISMASLVVGTILAAAYGIGEFTGDLPIDIPQMARWHGPLNGIGFTVCGLLGWVLAEQRRG